MGYYLYTEHKSSQFNQLFRAVKRLKADRWLEGAFKAEVRALNTNDRGDYGCQYKEDV